KRMDVEKGATRLHNFFSASTELMQVMARACGHDALDQFSIEDLTTWKKEMTELTGIGYAGVGVNA
ncbi:MAG: glutamate synthase, partial [Halioglobus sp.]